MSGIKETVREGKTTRLPRPEKSATQKADKPKAVPEAGPGKPAAGKVDKKEK